MLQKTFEKDKGMQDEWVAIKTQRGLGGLSIGQIFVALVFCSSVSSAGAPVGDVTGKSL